LVLDWKAEGKRESGYADANPRLMKRQGSQCYGIASEQNVKSKKGQLHASGIGPCQGLLKPALHLRTTSIDNHHYQQHST